jgi:hypothetical protein
MNRDSDSRHSKTQPRSQVPKIPLDVYNMYQTINRRHSAPQFLQYQVWVLSTPKYNSFYSVRLLIFEQNGFSTDFTNEIRFLISMLLSDLIIKDLYTVSFHHSQLGKEHVAKSNSCFSISWSEYRSLSESDNHLHLKWSIRDWNLL